MVPRADPALWILPACAILTLSGVGLLVPRRAALAAPPPPPFCAKDAHGSLR